MRENVSSILAEAHGIMKNQYASSASEDNKEAKIIENFLKELKYRAANRGNESDIERFQNDIYDLILDNLKLKNNRTIGKLFRRTGKSYKQGMYFEEDFSAVIETIFLLTGNKNNEKNINLGSKVGTTDIDLLKAVENIAEEETKNIIKETAKQLKSNKPGFVMGKIDTSIKGEIINLNASIEFPPGLLNALSNSSFTDKSYRSESWKDGKKIDLGGREITLGNSNPYRALLGSMSFLGFSKNQFQHVFYGGRNIINGIDNTPPKEDADYVKQHLYHLKYLYELTGVGIYYKDFGNNFFSGAKFLVYNDPSSLDITVVSTKQIILDILNSENFPNNPYGNISIAKGYVKQLSNRKI